MNKRLYDVAFKQMAVRLSESRGSIKAAAVELGIDPGRISKWKHQYKGTGTITVSAQQSEDQKEIRRLQKELRGAQQERDILKKAVSIFSRGDGKYSDL